MRSTTFNPGFSTITVQEHRPGSKGMRQARHGQRRPKRSEQTVNEGQPVSTAGQGLGSSPGMHATLSLTSRTSISRVSCPVMASSAASNDVSALASWGSDGGCVVSLEQDKCRATIDFVARSAQEKRRGRDRVQFTADLGSAKERSAQDSAHSDDCGAIGRLRSN